LIRAQEIVNKDSLASSSKPVLSLEYGKRYVKVVRSDACGGRCVHCFVDTTNGDVLKAASWKAPAKGARGNIYIGSQEGVSAWGGLYRR